MVILLFYTWELRYVLFLSLVEAWAEELETLCVWRKFVHSTFYISLLDNGNSKKHDKAIIDQKSLYQI